MIHFVVMINMRSGQKKYLRFLDDGRTGYVVRLVVKRSQATKLESAGLANYISTKFWETRWDGKLYESRETVFVEIKKR